MRKRIISLFLAAVMLAGLLPMQALAQETEQTASSPVTVTVQYTAQMEGMMNPRLGAEVSSDLAESYGFVDQVAPDQVSALDVLVKAHEDILGMVEGMLEVGDSGFVTTVFGIQTENFGFYVNGVYPNDGVTGTTIATQSIQSGDRVDFFLYRDAMCSDLYTWFEQDGRIVTQMDAKGGDPVELAVKSIPAMNGYKYLTAQQMQAGAMPVGNAHPAWVNVADGSMEEIPDLVTDGWTGKVTLTAPQNAGTYYLTAYTSGDGATPCVMPLLRLDVQQGQTPEPPEKNVLDVITPELLFDAIKGENTGADAMTKPLVKPEGTNYIDEFYAVLNEDGSFKKWWGGRYGAKAIIELKSISDETILKVVDSERIEILKQPQQDTAVDLIFHVEEVGNTGNAKDVTVTVTVKAQEKPEKNVLDVITPELLFDAIKGENTSADAMTKPLVNPNGTNYIDDFYAVLNDDGTLAQWYGGRKPGKKCANITLKSIGNETILRLVDYERIEILKQPQQDTAVDLIFHVEEVGNTGNAKDVTVTVTVKAAQTESPLQKQLQAALDKYLVPENIQYNTIERPGVDFAEDLAGGNVRYDFKLPNVAAMAGYGWNEVTTTTKTTTPEAMEVAYKYVCKPIRDDVGGKPRTAVIAYTLEKDGASATKEISVTIPALTQQEIDEELAVLEQVQTHFFDGIQYKNFDAQNVTSDLQMFQEVNYSVDPDGAYRLNWVENAKDKSYFGFALPNQKSFDITYPDGDPGVFSATNLVLEQRPAKDTRAVISNTVSSIQLAKYAALYPDNADLQKLVDAPVTTEVLVRKVNADVNSITINGKKFPVTPDTKQISLLTDATLDEIEVSVELANKGAELLVNGSPCVDGQSVRIALTDGFAAFGIKVSDADSKQDGTRKESSFTAAVVSKPYLEGEIAKLPQPDHAAEDQIRIAKELLRQFDALDKADQQKIAGADALEGYRQWAEDPQKLYENQVRQVADQLFAGIRGKNPDANTVYTDLEKVEYARLTDDGIVWSEKPDNSDVQIV